MASSEGGALRQTSSAMINELRDLHYALMHF